MVRQLPLVNQLAVVAAVSLLMTACGGGGGAGPMPPGPPPPGVTGVSGSVTNTRGGSAVQGATITASGAGVTATTNAQGAYTLTLNPGTYDILASQPGMAASKFQGVIVKSGQTTTANLIMFSVFDATKPVQAPTMMVTGLSQSQSVSGVISFTVNVTAAAANLPIRRIDVRSSNMNALTQSEVIDSSTGTFTLNSTALANGSAFVDIITYDLNQDSDEMIIGFTVSNGPSGSAPATPTGLFLAAVTTGQSLSLFSTQRAQLLSALGIKQDPKILKVGGRSIHILAAPSNATLFVDVTWSPGSGATPTGYKVFRSFSASGPFAQVAQVPAASTFYDDPDPSLAPGVTVFYQVSAFNAGGESAPTGAIAVTPLPPFNLNLTGPVNNATGVLTKPTFTWTPTNLVGAVQGYDIFVQGLNDSSFAWFTTSFGIVDATSIVYGTGGSCSICPSLQSGKVYQWDIYEAKGQTIDSTDPTTGLPNSVAVAVANGGGLVSTVPAAGSLNGPFDFTTAQ